MTRDKYVEMLDSKFPVKSFFELKTKYQITQKGLGTMRVLTSHPSPRRPRTHSLSTTRQKQIGVGNMVCMHVDAKLADTGKRFWSTKVTLSVFSIRSHRRCFDLTVSQNNP